MAEFDTGFITDPKVLLYNQVERILKLRAQGNGAYESLWLLDSMLSPFKDEEYRDDTGKFLKNILNDGKSADANESFYKWFRAAVALMSKEGLWVQPDFYESVEDEVENIKAKVKVK